LWRIVFSRKYLLQLNAKSLNRFSLATAGQAANYGVLPFHPFGGERFPPGWKNFAAACLPALSRRTGDGKIELIME